MCGLFIFFTTLTFVAPAAYHELKKPAIQAETAVSGDAKLKVSARRSIVGRSYRSTGAIRAK